MVVDTSALIAILREEPERDAFVNAILTTANPHLSAVTVFETAMVAEGRFGPAAGADIEKLINQLGLEIVPFNSGQAAAAGRAWRGFGKGNHPARLNLGDCCVYALAKILGEPVLCKGDDFRHTDISVVNVASEPQ